MREKELDFSYKKSAHRCYYDIESLPSLFTAAFYHPKAATLVFFGSPHYDDISDEWLKVTFRSYMDDAYHRELLKIESADELDINLVRIKEGENFAPLRKVLASFATCVPIPTDLPYVDGNKAHFTEYIGWNSYSYDLPMHLFILLASYAKMDDTPITPLDIRRISDTVVAYDGPRHKMGDTVDRKSVV